jgi:hypothetical protein
MLGLALYGFIGAPAVILLLASMLVKTPPVPPPPCPLDFFADDEGEELEHADKAVAATVATAMAATRFLGRDTVLTSPFGSRGRICI